MTTCHAKYIGGIRSEEIQPAAMLKISVDRDPKPIQSPFA
jgi:hypothetical protein